MDAGRWYRFDDLFLPERTLVDGTRLFASDKTFAGAALTAATAPARAGYQALQFGLTGLDTGMVDRLPTLASLAVRLASENLVPLPAAGFPFELRLRKDGEGFRSSALVCAELQLHSLEHRSGPPGDKLREVESAFERGLLDTGLRGRADFRLRIRPLIDEFEALRDSGYVPDWRVNAIFAKWRDDQGDWIASPVPSGNPEALVLMFEAYARDRGFRVSDLFSINREQ